MLCWTLGDGDGGGNKLTGITEVTNDPTAAAAQMLLITSAKTEDKTNDGDC